MNASGAFSLDQVHVIILLPAKVQLTPLSLWSWLDWPVPRQSKRFIEKISIPEFSCVAVPEIKVGQSCSCLIIPSHIADKVETDWLLPGT